MRNTVSKRLRKQANLKLGRDKSPKELIISSNKEDSLVKENPAYKLYKSLKKDYKIQGTKLQ